MHAVIFPNRALGNRFKGFYVTRTLLTFWWEENAVLKKNNKISGRWLEI
jgi:hypothetical protein